MDGVVAHLPVFATVVAVNLIGWATPGPNMMAVAAATLSGGRRAGFATGAGLAVGGLLWAGLAVAGVGVVFETLPTLFLILKLLGAGYLIWVGWRTIRTAQPGGFAPPGRRTGRRSFLFGVTVILSNPKAVLFYGAILAAVVPVGAPAWLLVAIVLLSQVQAVLMHMVTAQVFATRTATGLFQWLGAWGNRLFGGLFIALGLGVVWRSIRQA